jgi:hypothetical protein
MTELTIGTLVKVEPGLQVWIDYPDNPRHTPLVAISVASVTTADVGRRAVLAFADGDPEQPILLGLVRPPSGIETPTQTRGPFSAAPVVGAVAETPHLHVEAEETMTLTCGQASLSLHKDGRVIGRGTNVATYADGTLRLRGAGIELN